MEPMSNIPSDLMYTAEHEWIQQTSETTIRVGITDHAQDALGDIVFITLPAVGTDVAAGSACGEVESTKSVSDIYAPITGTITAVNSAVETAPETINSDPYGAGWLFDVSTASAPTGLLTADEYSALLGE